MMYGGRRFLLFMDFGLCLREGGSCGWEFNEEAKRSLVSHVRVLILRRTPHVGTAAICCFLLD